MRNFSITAFLMLLMIGNIYAQGGMWLPNELEGKTEANMKKLGMQISAEDIYSIEKRSLKDAIVQFGGGCTAEIISPQGLLLTNHHCGYGSIQRLSSLEDNYLKNGFWAKTLKDELNSPGLTVTMVDKIDDVTDIILKGTSDDLSPKANQSIIDKNIDSLRKTIQTKSYEEIEITPFYYGNKYYMFHKKIFSDIRLVGVAPEAIGKFGADTDNWMWPRHNADFSLFRIYVNKDNEPAEYSEDNVPYKPKHYLPISMDGVEEKDFTLVFGFPGRTQEYLPASAVEQIANKLNPVRIKIRKTALDVMDKHMRKDEGTKLKYASKFAGIANYWKKWIGESQGINAVNAVEKKRAYEKELMANIAKNSEANKKYGNILHKLDSLYNEFEKYNIARNAIYETYVRSNDYMAVMSYLNRLQKYYKNNGVEGYNGFKNRLLPYLKGMYKNFDINIDKDVFLALIKNYVDAMAPEFVPASLKNLKTDKEYNEFADKIYSSVFTDYDKLATIVDTSDIEWAIAQFEKDLGYKFAGELSEINDNIVSVKYNEIDSEIQALQKKYMKAQLEYMPNKKFFPDANSTLRVTYGQVNGYYPRDAVYYEPVTHLSGVMGKYVPGDYEFDLPKKLLDVYASDNHDKYKDKTGDVPVCFIATNHTTGGNSGSPALDKYGNLIGLNFDRVWEGTMSDLYYDPKICRNIMVDVRYILFLIEKIGDSQRIIDELDIVYPKR